MHFKILIYYQETFIWSQDCNYGNPEITNLLIKIPNLKNYCHQQNCSANEKTHRDPVSYNYNQFNDQFREKTTNYRYKYY